MSSKAIEEIEDRRLLDELTRTVSRQYAASEIEEAKYTALMGRVVAQIGVLTQNRASVTQRRPLAPAERSSGVPEPPEAGAEANEFFSLEELRSIAKRDRRELERLLDR